MNFGGTAAIIYKGSDKIDIDKGFILDPQNDVAFQRIFGGPEKEGTKHAVTFTVDWFYTILICSKICTFLR